jgi:hypothetical protein
MAEEAVLQLRKHNRHRPPQFLLKASGKELLACKPRASSSKSESEGFS